MKILILGGGQVGRTAAEHLSREEANEVTVIDVNEDVLRDLQDRLDVRTVAGNAAHPTVLEAAGAAEAEIIVALTSSDEVNMLACQVAFTLFRTPTKIARIRAAEYTSRAGLLFGGEGLSVDVVISPEQLVTDYVERLIHHPGTLQVLDFADGKVRLVGVRARRGGLLVGRTLKELPQHMPKMEVRVVAIYRDGRSVAPEGDTLIEDGDELFFLAARDDIRRVMAELRQGDTAARRIVIAGGGNIGFRLAKTLEKNNQVKLIERDPRRARKVSELLENAIVLHGDAADEELLIEENIDSADVFAAMTNAEEANILSAMLARRLGARKVLALINKPSYTELVESGSIDIAISPQTITIGSLLAHVRRGDVVRVHALKRGAAEALEAVVHGDERSSRIVGRTVAQVPLPEGASIGAVVRGDEVIMAHHDTLILADDHVILFLADRRHLEAVERLFVRSAR
jgi:trk system potassium uptake protein TrkA